MKRNYIVCAALALGLAVGGLSKAVAGEKMKPSPDVAAKVTVAVKGAFPEAVISDMANESEDGLNFIEVSLTANGARISVDVMADGTIVESEQSADISSFPPKAIKALKHATRGMEIEATDIATTNAVADKNDPSGNKAVKLTAPTIAFEQDVKKGAEKGEFAVDAEGKMLESPRWYKAAEMEEIDEKDEGKESK